MKMIMAILFLLPAASADEWKLVWSDEFDKPGLPDSTKWGYETGMIRNNESQYYTAARKENARVENGTLVIEARKESWPAAAAVSPSAGKAVGQGRPRRAPAHYTSASLTTRGKAAWTTIMLATASTHIDR